MIDTLGFIGGWLFLLKVILHIYLMSRIDKDFAEAVLFRVNSLQRGKTFLPFTANVPEKYKIFKIIINVLYAISLVLIAIFLIDFNLKK